MVFGWIKSKIKKKSSEDEYERIKQSIIARGGEIFATKPFEDEKITPFERFRKEREEVFATPLEPWERERLEREEIRPEWRPIREKQESTFSRKENEFEPTLLRREEIEIPYQKREIDLEHRALEQRSMAFGESERINNRLRFIEEQLSTIKAQNEVLIEKLRSIERRLGYI